MEVPREEINQIDGLPVILITSEEEEMHVNMNLEMNDSTHDMLVKWGKEVATDEDYVQIALSHGIKEALECQKKKE